MTSIHSMCINWSLLHEKYRCHPHSISHIFNSMNNKAKVKVHLQCTQGSKSKEFHVNANPLILELETNSNFGLQFLNLLLCSFQISWNQEPMKPPKEMMPNKHRFISHTLNLNHNIYKTFRHNYPLLIQQESGFLAFFRVSLVQYLIET